MAAVQLVSVTFEQQGRLGINFEWPFIESIEEFSLAARHAQLEPGLILIGVQGRGVEGLSLDTGSKLFRALPPPCGLLTLLNLAVALEQVVRADQYA